MAGKIIEADKLTKYYGKQKGIENLSFQVEEGEIYGFIGPNGAGKSTTIRTLLALIRPTAGSAAVFGMDCIKKAPEIAADVGYLPAEAGFYENMRVSELLRYTADLYGKDCRKRTDELCGRLKLDTKRKIADLSLGNKKKVSILCAMLHQPRLLILDEPTGGLDPLMQQTFIEILREENQAGTTILFSSHILSEVQKICGRVAIMKDGAVVQVQKIRELKEAGYKKIRLHIPAEVTSGVFEGPGIADFKRVGPEISFLFTGNIRDFLMRMSELPVEDILIEEPALEEIFLHYYK